MGLNKAALKSAILAVISAETNTRDTVAQGLADAIDAYVKGASVSVTVSTTVVDSQQQQIGTGSGSGTGSLS